MAIVALAALGFLAGCGDGGGDDPPTPPRPRLIVPADSDFPALEQPEDVDECADTVDCEISCLWSCALPPDGPFTCPIQPVPMPERLASAVCLCERNVCAWYANPP